MQSCIDSVDARVLRDILRPIIADAIDCHSLDRLNEVRLSRLNASWCRRATRQWYRGSVLAFHADANAASLSEAATPTRIET
jgi:hypothetical protein